MTVLLSLLSTLLGWAPASWVRGWATLWGYVWFDVLRYRRRVMLENLAIAFPEVTDAERRATARATCVNLVWSLFELFRLPTIRKRGYPGVRVEGLEHFERAKAEGKGVFCLASHLGSPDICVGAVAGTHGPLWLIVKSFPSAVDRFVTKVREDSGIGIIRAGVGGRDVFRALRAGEGVVAVLDQNATRSIGVFVDFFGKPACTMNYLALLVLRSRTPVVPCETFREPDGTNVLRLHPPIPVEEKDTPEESIVHMTGVYTAWIERAIRAHPTQWFWHHKRWRTRPLPNTDGDFSGSSDHSTT